MTKKHKEFTREEYEAGMKLPPFSYSGWQLEEHMKYYDSGQEFARNHPYKLPKDMKEVSFAGFCSDDISDYPEIMCECSDEKFTISEGYLTFCPNCGRGYRVIAHIAQYEKK
jgi:hypothetical protein